MRPAMTPEDLLNQWKILSASYVKHMTVFPKQRDTIMAMDWQLRKCMEDLEKMISGEYTKKEFLTILLKQLRQNEIDLGRANKIAEQ